MGNSDIYIKDGYIEQEKQKEHMKSHKKNVKYLSKLASILVTLVTVYVFIKLTVSVDSIMELSPSRNDFSYMDKNVPVSSGSQDKDLLVNSNNNNNDKNNNNNNNMNTKGGVHVVSPSDSSGSVISLGHKGKLVQQDGVVQAPVVKDSIEKEYTKTTTTALTAKTTKTSTTPTLVTPSSVTSSALAKQSSNIKSHTFQVGMELHEILNTSPMVIFGRKNDKDSQYLYNLLTKEYEISPEPIFVDLDKHQNGDQIQKYIQTKKIVLHKETDSNNKLDIPYLFINGVSVINTGITQDIKNLHTSNRLVAKFKEVASDNVSFKKNESPSNT